VGNVTTERRKGLFNPFTATGTIVVDGVVASVQSKWFADDVMDALGLMHAVPALYQARPLDSNLFITRMPPRLTQSHYICSPNMVSICIGVLRGVRGNDRTDT